MNHTAEAVDALALLDEAAAGGTGGRTARAGAREADHDQRGAAEFADIPELPDSIGLRMNCDMVGAVSCADTVLADCQDLATLKQNGHVHVVQIGLLGVAILLGIDVRVQGAVHPCGKGQCGKSHQEGVSFGL